MTSEEAKEFIAQSVKSDADMALVADAIEALEQEPKTWHCKDYKWWKDSYGAESQYPINRKAVYEGNGYCFLFKSQDSKK